MYRRKIFRKLPAQRCSGFTGRPAPRFYAPANFFLATGRANAFVGPCPLFAITLR
jgi:hypothetical protein